MGDGVWRCRMMVMYALERRHFGFTLGFAAGCLLSSIYGFLAGAWPFGVVELVGSWARASSMLWNLDVLDFAGLVGVR